MNIFTLDKIGTTQRRMDQMTRLIMVCIMMMGLSAFNIVHATNYTWNGLGVTGGTGNASLNTTTNWAPNGTPGAGDNVTFNFTATATSTPLTMSGSMTFGSLTITNTTALTAAETFSITVPNGVTLTTSAASGQSGNLSITNTCTGKVGTINIAVSTGGTLNVGGALTLANGAANQKDVTEITNAGTMTVTGATLLKGNTTVAGITEINFGTNSTTTFLGNVTYDDNTSSGTALIETNYTGSNSAVYYDANLSFGKRTETVSLTSTTNQVYFDGTGAQTITDGGDLSYNIFLNLQIGKVNTPTVTLTPNSSGIGVNLLQIYQNLTISTGATLILSATAATEAGSATLTNYYWWTDQSGTGATNGTFTNNGTLVMNSPYSNALAATGYNNMPLGYASFITGPVSTFSYTCTLGAQSTYLTGTFYNVIVNNTSGVTLSGASTISTSLTLTAGTFTNSTYLTMASGSLITRTAGSLSAAPTWGGTVNVLYNNTGALTSGYELPLVASHATALNNLTMNGSNGVTLVGGPSVGAQVNGILAMTNGVLTSSAADPLKVVNTVTTAVTGGSASSYVNGPLSWTLPASLSSSSNNYIYPLGNGGAYLPFGINNLTTGTTGPVITAQATDANSTGTAGTGMTAISNTEYWNAAVTSGNFTSGAVSIGKASLGLYNAIGQSSTQAGAYASIGGSISGSTIGNEVPVITSLGYFVLGTKFADLNDAGVTAIIVPSPLCAGSQPVSVTVYNYGTLPITSVTITAAGCSLSPLTVSSGTGFPIASGSSATVSMGNYTFTTGSNTINAATSLPNGVTDNTPSNDADAVTVSTGLSGTYTVGPTGNYTTLTAAVNAYNTSSLCGPVVFSLQSTYTSGSETFPIVIDANTYASSTNTLTIEPAASATISGSSASAIIELFGAKYVTINGATGGSGSTQNLTITNTNTGTSSAVIWVSNSGTAGATNNTIENCVITGNAATTTLAGIANGPLATGTYSTYANSNNTYTNNAVTKAQNGILLQGTTGGTETGNSITGNTVGTIGFQGVVVDYEPAVSISGNTISGVTSTTGAAFGLAVDDNCNGANIYDNNINTISASNSGGYFADGIILGSSSSSSNINVYNNYISQVTSYGFTAAANAPYNGYPIMVYSGGGYNIYFNSAYQSTTQAGGVGKSAGLFVYSSGSPIPSGLNVEDNIFYSVEPGSTNYGVYSQVAKTAYTSINYNDYVATDIGFLGSAQTTLAGWQGVISQDANSIANVTPTFTSSTNLALTSAAGNTALQTGTPISSPSITTDIVGHTRNSTTPYIGAFEIAPVPNDAGVTAITTTSTCPGTYTVSVTVKNYGSNTITSVTVTTTPATSLSPHTFTGLSIPAAGGTVVLNLGTYTFVGGANNITAATSLPNGTTDGNPANDSYSTNISMGLSGTYTVGAGGNYTTLTAAVAAYNSAPICGPVVFSLTQATYSTSETFPIVINNNTGASSTNTLTIKPASGITPTITGSPATVLLELNGASYIIVDGSNTAGGTTQNLTFDNTYTTAGTNADIWIASASVGATNNTIENCVLTGISNADLVGGIISGANSGVGNQATVANSNNTVQNNTFTAMENGLYLYGAAAYDQNWVITGNTFGAASGAGELSFRGMILQSCQNFTISNNTVLGVTNGGGNDISGIQIAGACLTGSIYDNSISNITNTNTLGYGSNGIWLDQTNTAAAITIYNNFIYDMTGYGNGTGDYDNAGNGIDVYSGSGYNIYFNTIYQNVNSTTASIPTCIYVESTVTAAGAVNLENNILVNTETNGTRYGIYCAAAATVFGTIDYNDYYGSSDLGYLGGNKTTIVAWATATGKDAHSGNILPSFVSTTDLDLTNYNNFCLASGIAISGITTDIHGNTRVVPVMGADEISYTFGSTTAAATCPASNTTVTVTAPASTLAAGSYTVTYSLSGANTTASATATMTYVAGGTNAGTFTVPGSQLANTGATTITITAIQPVTACAANFSSKALPVTNAAADQATITVVTPPAGGTIAPVAFCTTTGSGVVTITGVSNVTDYVWSLPSGLTGSSTTSSITVSGTVPGTYTVSVTPRNAVSGVTCTESPQVTGIVTINPLITPSVTLSEAPGDSVITYGTGIIFTATPTNGGSSPAYNFYVGTSLVQSGSSNTYTTTTMPVGNDSVKCVMTSDSSCLTTPTATSNTIHVKVDAGINTWTGAVSNVWTNVNNWTNDVPTCSLDGLIPSNLTRYPVISSAVSIRNLTIQTGAAVVVSTTGSLSVCGNISTVSSQTWSGSVTLQGTGAQTLSGPIAFNNLEVNGNYTVGPGSNDRITVAGILNKAGGTLNTNNKLTLLATSSQTALIADNGGSLAGDVSMQQYVYGNVGYHHISSPMSSATVGNLSGFVLYGTNGVRSGYSQQEGSLEEYTESVNTFGVTDSGYYNYTSLSNPLTPGIGYTALFDPTPSTMATYGSPSSGNINVTVTNTAGHQSGVEGWNFVGNPYPSPISWSAVKTLNSSISSLAGTCYIWVPSTPSTGTWTGYNGTSGTRGAGNVISSSQGFWVDVTGVGSYTMKFSNAVRTQDLNPLFYKAPELQANELRLDISSASDPGSEALMYTEDSGEGSAVLPPMESYITSPTISYINPASEERDMIYVAKSINENTEIPLSVHIGASGSYTVNAVSINVTDMPVYILDNATNTYYDLSGQSVTINSQGNENIKGRYSVVYSRKTRQASAGTTNIYGKASAIEIERTDGESPAQVTVTDMLGREVASVTATGSSIEIPVPDAYAIYMVTVTSNGTRTIKKVIVRE